MSNMFFVLLILIGIVVATIIQNHWKMIPLPIIFIIIGVFLSVIPLYQHYIFNPSLFLFLIISPLLYNDAQSASRYWIGRGAVNIFSLSIMLVIATVVFVGFGVHAIFKFIPLALAFALCAIVTPTDASAVSAFARPNKKLQIPFTILQNESLFNDATGFVIFDIALIAVIGGSFSWTMALTDFILEFAGGLLFGAIVGALFHMLRSFLISINDDSPLVMISIEMLVPFLVYFLADHFNLSGVLAVVAAGLVQGMENDNLRLSASRMQLVRNNAWEMAEEALTGGVFVLLGISLPTIIERIFASNSQLLLLLVLVAAVVYTLKLVIRLLWTRYLVWMHLPSNHRWKDSWLMAVSGASGTISLSLAFLLPEDLSYNGALDRDALIFIVTVVILLSLTIAAVIVPKLTKPEENSEKIKPIEQWSREMIMVAMAKIKLEKDYPSEVQIVTDALSSQLHQHKRSKRRERIRLFKLGHDAELKELEQQHRQGNITDDEYKYYQEFMALSLYTVNFNLIRNILLRIRFGIHIGRLYQDVHSVQDILFTSPLIAEQYYWRQQFELHGEDIKPIEDFGYRTVMKALRGVRKENGSSSELHEVQSFYQQRHRRLNLPQPQSTVLYQLFLEAFHTEYEYFQQALVDGRLDVEVAEELEQNIIYDEMAYIQNHTAFLESEEPHHFTHKD